MKIQISDLLKKKKNWATISGVVITAYNPLFTMDSARLVSLVSVTCLATVGTEFAALILRYLCRISHLSEPLLLLRG